MTEKMRFTAAFAAVLGVAMPAAEAGVIYPDEAVVDWFNDPVAGMSAGSITTSGNWTPPTGGEADKVDSAIKFDADVAAPLVYRAGTSGVIALVDVSLVVDPNAAMPGTTDLEGAQAAISVVTNTTSDKLEWIGLVGNGGSREWRTLSGDEPTAGATYEVQIAIDNRAGQKKIRYAVKAPGATSDFTVLKSAGDEWLDNPKGTSMSSVSAVAFAGAGTVSQFYGKSLKDDGAAISDIANAAGYDYTNGTVTAVVTLPSDNDSGATRTATLKVVDFRTGTTKTYNRTVTSGETISWDLSDLTAGGTYSYTITVKSGDVAREVKAGTFTAGSAKFDDNWFKLAVVNDQVVTNNGTFAGAEFNATKWDVTSDATFTVTDSSAGIGAVARVDTAYAFSSFTDAESLESLSDALGGIVAVSDNGGSWYAYTGDGASAGWAALTGGIVPEANVEYVVRAEFDFLSTTKRVRYMVRAASGTEADFMPLALANGSEWISVASGGTTLTSVGVSGSGYVAKILANVSDAAVAVAGGSRYASLWEALKNGNAVTLLTNATLKPTGAITSRGPFTIKEGDFDFIFDKSGMSGKWKFEEKDGVWYLSKPGATYIFF